MHITNRRSYVRVVSQPQINFAVRRGMFALALILAIAAWQLLGGVVHAAGEVSPQVGQIIKWFTPDGAVHSVVMTRLTGYPEGIVGSYGADDDRMIGFQQNGVSGTSYYAAIDEGYLALEREEGRLILRTQDGSFEATQEYIDVTPWTNPNTSTPPATAPEQPRDDTPPPANGGQVFCRVWDSLLGWFIPCVEPTRPSYWQ